MSTMQKETHNTILTPRILRHIQIPEYSDSLKIHIYWNRTSRNAKGYARWNRKQHKHTFLEMHMTITGSCIYLLEDGRKMPVSSDEFILFAPNTEHQLIDRSDDYNKFALGFDIKGGDDDEESLFVKSVLGQFPCIVRQKTEFMMQIMDRYIWEASHTLKGFKNALRAYIWLLLVEMARQIEPQQSLQNDMTRMVSSDELYDRVCQYISDNITKALSSDEVAAHVHLSTKQLNRIMQNDQNITIVKVIEKIKADYAKSLLLNTPMTMHEISDSIGCSNEYNFIRFFKRVEGMTPGAFRKSK
jgi:AraC-like DNA-binding protein